MAEIIFVDTWGWVALADRRDRWHEAARETYRELSARPATFVTTNVVVYETYGLVRSRCSHGTAVALVDNIRRMGTASVVLSLVWVEPAIEDAAVSVLWRHDDKDFSFVDCISFAVMQELGVNTAFTGDEHFRQIGFETVPPRH